MKIKELKTKTKINNQLKRNDFLFRVFNILKSKRKKKNLLFRKLKKKKSLLQSDLMIIILHLNVLNERNEIINLIFDFEVLLFFFQNLLIIKTINIIQIMSFL